MSTLRLRVLTTNVSVRLAEAIPAEHLEALTGNYATTTQRCTLSYRIEPGELWRDDQLIRRTEVALDVLAAFELDLYRSVVARACDAGWLVHAAALELRGHVLLLAGESGVGKSTLALALLDRGARYLTDECALVSPEGQVRGLRRPISFDAGQVKSLELPFPRGFRRLSYPVRQTATEMQDPLLLHPPRESIAEQPLPLGTVVALRYAPNGTPGARRLSPGEALCALWPSALAGDDRALRAATELLSRYPVFELETRTVAEACDRLCELHRAPERRG